MADLEPRVAALTAELLSTADPDRWDVITELANPLPVTVIAELLGLPPSDREQFRSWVEPMLAQRTGDPVVGEDLFGERTAEIAEPVRALRQYLRDQCRQRRREPREDLLTALVQAEVDGARLADEELVNFADLLLIAGHITTSLLVGNTVLCLQRPGVADHLRAAWRDQVPDGSRPPQLEPRPSTPLRPS